MTHPRRLLIASFASSTLLGGAGFANAGASFHSLGQGIASAVSGDGSTVVGAGNGGFIWTLGGGLVPIGGVGAQAVSQDGSIVAGDVNVGSFVSAGRYVGGSWTDFGALGPAGCDASLSSTYGISGDGSIVVGLGWNGCAAKAFRWTEATGMVALPQMGSGSTRANAISADGSFIGGWDEGSGGGRRAALWSGEMFVETLLLAGEPGNAAGEGEINGLNSDGSIIVGQANSALSATRGPFVRRAGEGISYLGDIPGTAPNVSGALDTSDDGSVIVGFQREGFGGFAVFDATIWTESTGTVRLSDYLAGLGVAVPPTLQLAAALSVSDDGTVISGWGYSGFIFNQIAWVATLPGAAPCGGDLNGDGLVDGADMGALLAAWGPCAGCAADLDGDGVVDGADMGILLAAWGACG
ncbi:MAG TPA: hypothetical protein PKC43_05655 [Phycisphaerales bacterium]|nr:hypothetical protein [Phycisphaerales bacterium]HMP36917.1 hypothetical protein [Phycisphaerales bacterium]